MAETNLPTPQSYEQILSDALSAYAAKIGIDDFNVGSAVTSFFEVVALTTARASGDIFQILRDFSVDRATGDALQRLAIENNVIPVTASPATGSVSVIDTRFEKISTNVYAGLPSPNIGSTSIAVGDASDFDASGSIYIGRGTPNVEGPLAYAAPPVQVGSYWVITLSVPTTKFHNIGESVIMAQGGNRSIPANSVVVAPAIGANSDIQYNVSQAAIILDGEIVVNNVPITAILPGSDGNVPAGTITKFTSPPFTGAEVNNTLPITTGTDNETDDELRVRIKRALASKGLGTATAVESAVDGAKSDNPTSAIVTSTDIIDAAQGAVLFIDNGRGYEETSTGVGLESIVDSALGGERFFQLACAGNQSSVAKAYLQSVLGVPFDLVGGDALAVEVGGTTYQHTFADSDFRSPGAATAYEIATSINSNTALGFEGLTAGGGTFVVIRSKTEGNDSIQIVSPITNGRDAAAQIGFSSGQIETLRLYKNKVPLNKDGRTATVSSQPQELWSSTIADGDTLILAVDGTDAITYTITNADFIATGLFTTVANTNSLESWVQVFNSKLTGVTAEIVGNQLEITSNLGANNRASVVIDASSTLVNKGMFSASLELSAFGSASDYTLSRNTAQLELIEPLEPGDSLTAGSNQTAARIQSDVIAAGSITFPADGYMWMLVDTFGEIIPTGVVGSTNISVSKPATNVIRYTSNIAGAFGNVQIGDYLIVWSPDLVLANRLEGRVNAVTSSTLDIGVTAVEYAAAVPVANVVFSNGFVVARCAKAPQKFKVDAGTATLDQIATQLQGQSNQVVFSTLLDQYLVATSNTLDVSGSLMIVTNDSVSQAMNFTVGQLEVSNTSLIAAYNSQAYDAEMPLFVHSTAAAPGVVAQPPDSFLSSFTSALSLAGRDPNELVAFLHPYGSVRDAQTYGDFVQETTIAGALIGITEKATVRRVRGDTYLDRYYLAAPLSFGPNDTAVVIVDNDPTTSAFEIPFYRVATTNTTLAVNTNTFNAYDSAAGPTATFASGFGASFDFSNFAVLMQAKYVLKPSPTLTALLYRSTPWGRSGEKIRIAYVYPSIPNAVINSVVTNDDFVHININLSSGATVSTGISSSTEWNITVTPNTPSAGIDQVTYTWNGVGTDPTLSLSGGEYVNIGQNTGFDLANTGVFRVSDEVGFTPTATSFSVQMPNGVAVAEANVSTLVNGAIIFYLASPTTALQIDTYINASLSQYVTSTIVNDGGTSGAGVVELSTYEDSGFTVQYVQLADGINWLDTSNLGGSPQFTFKNPLSYPSDGPGDAWYAFNDEEAVRISPTTMEQVMRFISTLAVTGFTTLGDVSLVERGTRLQLSTSTLGSDGAIQIVGGLANGYQTPVLDSATRINNTLMSVSANIVASAGIQSDQWLKLEASNLQAKSILLSSNTSATIIPDVPAIGQSIVRLLNRQLNQRYFGKPRHHVRPEGRTFRIEKQGELVCLSANPDISTSPTFQKVLNLNDSGGGTVDITPMVGSSNLQYDIASGAANFNELSINDLITIAGGGLDPANVGTFLVTGVSDDGNTITTLNADGVLQAGVAFVAGDFSASSQVSEGDTVILSDPFDVLNQGQFRVIRRYNDSIWYENSNVVEEEVSTPLNSISLGFDATTDFSVDASNNTQYLKWNGLGTEPNLEDANVGDLIEFGTDFAAANQGVFMVLRSGVKLQEIANFVMPAGTNFSPTGAGAYFDINSAGNTNLYRIWFNVLSGTNIAPGAGGRTLAQVDINAFDTAATVANNAAAVISALNAASDFNTSTSGSVLTVTTQDSIETTNPINGTMPSPFSVNVTQDGRRTFLECVNPSAVNEASVMVAGDVLIDNRPQIVFFEYEATVPGDKVTITNNAFNANNVDSWVIVRVIDRDNVIVSGTMTAATNVSLNGIVSSLFVEESVPYSGYKHVVYAVPQPGASSRNVIVFDTNAQYDKINQAALVQMASLSKLNFSTVIKNGLDSYRFNTGLVQEANRIIYGDPRDSVTYPGVGAAGAEIFVRGPLIRRIQVSLSVRLNTGVPFSQTVQQVQNTVTSLVNSNKLGQALAISSIVAAVSAIPGILAVSVSFPDYDINNDVIVLAPGEKALIIDPTVDVSVSQVGT